MHISNEKDYQKLNHVGSKEITTAIKLFKTKINFGLFSKHFLNIF